MCVETAAEKSSTTQSAVPCILVRRCTVLGWRCAAGVVSFCGSCAAAAHTAAQWCACAGLSETPPGPVRSAGIESHGPGRGVRTRKSTPARASACESKVPVGVRASPAQLPCLSARRTACPPNMARFPSVTTLEQQGRASHERAKTKIGGSRRYKLLRLDFWKTKVEPLYCLVQRLTDSALNSQNSTFFLFPKKSPPLPCQRQLIRHA